jgi:4-diphosphocytidyl-2-C-methyl-D-erythritol kinase
MRSLRISSYAKLNLFLKVVGRFPNGYHKLVTIFHRISLHDTLRLEKRKSGFSLTVKGAGLSAGEDNLIARAYRVLKAECPEVGGVSVFLNKKIPIGGGLGGGSSNAATFLLGMNRLYSLGLSEPKMRRMGTKLGADVPFFILDIPQAVGRGVGEKLAPRRIGRKIWFVLIVAPKGLATHKVYQNLPKRLSGPSLTKVNRTVKLICNLLEGRDKSSLCKWLCNDLEEPAFRLRPSLQKLLHRFRKLGVSASGMSGSGPTLFAILTSRKEAVLIAKKWRGSVVRGNNRRTGFSPAIVCHSA